MAAKAAQGREQIDYAGITVQTGFAQPRGGGREFSTPFLEAGWRLLRLSWKNKFNPLSPDEAEVEFSQIRHKFAIWTNFTNRADVSESIDGVNRLAQAKSQEQRKAARQAEQAFLAYIESDEFARTIQKTAATVTERLNEMAVFARDLGEYGNEDDLPVLRRLLLVVHFMRATYDFDPAVEQAVARFLTTHSSASSEELLTSVIRRK
jgi:hypothetical protein